MDFLSFCDFHQKSRNFKLSEIIITGVLDPKLLAWIQIHVNITCFMFLSSKCHFRSKNSHFRSKTVILVSKMKVYLTIWREIFDQKRVLISSILNFEFWKFWIWILFWIFEFWVKTGHAGELGDLFVTLLYENFMEISKIFANFPNILPYFLIGLNFEYFSIW